MFIFKKSKCLRHKQLPKQEKKAESNAPAAPKMEVEVHEVIVEAVPVAKKPAGRKKSPIQKEIPEPLAENNEEKTE